MVLSWTGRRRDVVCEARRGASCRLTSCQTGATCTPAARQTLKTYSNNLRRNEDPTDAGEFQVLCSAQPRRQDYLVGLDVCKRASPRGRPCSAGHKRFQIRVRRPARFHEGPLHRATNFRQNFARFRLYRHRSLQVNMRFAACFKIYQIM